MTVTIRDIKTEWTGVSQLATFVVEKEGREPYGEAEYHDGLFCDWDNGNMVTWNDDLTRDERKQIGEQLDTWLLMKNGSVLAN